MNEMLPDALTLDTEPRSAYEQAAEEGIDPRCIPMRLEEEPPVGAEIEVPDYADRDQRTWQILFERQANLLPGRASEAFLSGIKTLGLTSAHIPTLPDLSARLEETTGWRVARIPGLLHERNFFDLLARRIFPSTDYIRGVEELDYTPAPDLFHDIFGHMPMLTQPAFADFYQLVGQAGLKAQGRDRTSLERLHWFTVEFGLIRQDEGLRIYGAGILSSQGEVWHALSDEVTVHPFDVRSIIAQEYEVWHLQDELFAVDSFEQLETGFRDWMRARGLGD